MAIWRKKIKRFAEATIAIEAGNMNEAQKIFDDWCEDDENTGKLSDLLAEREIDDEVWTNTYHDKSEYDMACCMDDFHILCVEPEEPKYDLYFVIEESGIVKAYLECSIELVVEKIHENNKDYILRPSVPKHSAIVDSINHGSHLLYYRCERREKDV